MQELAFTLHNTPLRVVLESQVVDRFNLCRLDDDKRESGGQLFAIFPSPVEMRIVHASGPNKKARRRLFSFSHCLRDDQREIECLFDGEQIHYVGDWHSHPQDIPTPSWVDKITIRSRFIKSEHELKMMLMIIVGQAAFPDGIWVGAQDGDLLTDLACVHNTTW